MENWRNYLNEEEYLNEELLDEGLLDWVKEKSSAAITSIKDGQADYESSHRTKAV